MDTDVDSTLFFLETASRLVLPWFPAVQRRSLGDHFPEGNEEEEANDSKR